MDNSETFTVSILIYGEQELKILKKNMKQVFEKSNCALLKVTPTSHDGYEVELMLENFNMLYLLGKYVGCDKKRLLDEDC